MERLSLRKAICKIYSNAGWFSINEALSNKKLIKLLNCTTPLNRNRIRDEVSGMIREKVVDGRADKRDGDIYYNITEVRRTTCCRPQFSKAQRIALGLSL